MKKLIFIILTIFTISSDLFAWEACRASELRVATSRAGCPNSSYPNNPCFIQPVDEGLYGAKFVSRTPFINSMSITGDNPRMNYYCSNRDKPYEDKLFPIENESDYNFFCKVNSDNTYNCYQNPDPTSNKPRCDDTFIKDGKFYNCDPSTNEAQFVENSEGYEEDEESGIYPKCKAGYSAHNIGRIVSSNGSYSHTENQFYCLKQSNDSPDDFVGQTPKDTTSSTGSYYTGSDGSVSWTGTNGNNYNYDPKTNVLIETNFSNGTAGAHTVPSGWQPGQSFTPNGQGYSSSGSGGSSGTGGTGGTGNGGDTGTGGTGTGGDTGTDEPVDKEPAAKSCNDSTMTLQEKMLCEMNAGIKKLNSENTPSNSLNQLLKDLNNKSTQNNDSLDTLKNNTNVTNQNLESTNTKLDNLNTATNTTNSKLDNLNTTIGNLNNTLKDIEKNTKSTSTSLGGSSVIVGGGSGSGNTGNNGSTGEGSGEQEGEGTGKDISIDAVNSISNNNESLFDSVVSIYTTFSTNIQNSFNQIKTQIEDTQHLIKNPENIFSGSNINTCLTTYSFDFREYGIGYKNIDVDFCKYTSTLKPYIYFFVYVSLMLFLLFFTFRVVGFIL